MSNPVEQSDSSEPGFACPGCGERVQIDLGSVGQLVRCSYCNIDFFASEDQSHLSVVDDTLPAPPDADRESAINQNRIAQLTALRMGAIRSRSWWLVAFCMAVLTDLNLIARAIISVAVFHHHGLEPWAELAVAVLAGSFARYCWKRAAAFKREIDHSALAEPMAPPDFSTLGNGSDRWKNLENIR